MDGKSLRGDFEDKGFGQHRLDRILVEGRSGWSDIKGGLFTKVIQQDSCWNWTEWSRTEPRVRGLVGRRAEGPDGGWDKAGSLVTISHVLWNGIHVLEWSLVLVHTLGLSSCLWVLHSCFFLAVCWWREEGELPLSLDLVCRCICSEAVLREGLWAICNLYYIIANVMTFPCYMKFCFPRFVMAIFHLCLLNCW